MLLLLSLTAQLVGQAWLRWSGARDPGDGSWVGSHLVLLLAAVALCGAVALLVVLVGPGPATWLGAALFVVGQACALVVLGIDLSGGSDDVGSLVWLETVDFLAVLGLAVLLLVLRGRRPEVAVGADLALLGLSVPALHDLVVPGAALALVGSAALSWDLLRHRSWPEPRWLPVVTVIPFGLAALASWPRAVLALVVVVATVDHLRGGQRVEAAGSE